MNVIEFELLIHDIIDNEKPETSVEVDDICEGLINLINIVNDYKSDHNMEE